MCNGAIPLACTLKNMNFYLLIGAAAQDSSSVQVRCTSQENLQANQGASLVANSRSLDEGKK